MKAWPDSGKSGRRKSRGGGAPDCALQRSQSLQYLLESKFGCGKVRPAEDRTIGGDYRS